jgi:nicotinamide riboside kinase
MKTELKWRYDKVIYLPPEFEIEDDWVRHIDYDYQKYIDNQIKETYKKFNISFYEVRWDIQSRILQVLNIINGKNKKAKPRKSSSNIQREIY